MTTRLKLLFACLILQSACQVRAEGLANREMQTQSVSMDFKNYHTTLRIEMPRPTPEGLSVETFILRDGLPGFAKRNIIHIKEDDGVKDNALFSIEPLFGDAQWVERYLRSSLGVIYSEKQVDGNFLFVGRRQDKEYLQVRLVSQTHECSNCYVEVLAMCEQDRYVSYWKRYMAALFDRGFPTENDISFSALNNRKQEAQVRSAPAPAVHWRALAAGIHETLFQNRVSVGTSSTQSSSDAAESEAIEECKIRGFSECHTISTFNQGCGYVVSGSNGAQVGFGSGNSSEAASESCSARGLSCGTPIGGCVD